MELIQKDPIHRWMQLIQWMQCPRYQTLTMIMTSLNKSKQSIYTWKAHSRPKERFA